MATGRSESDGGGLSLARVLAVLVCLGLAVPAVVGWTKAAWAHYLTVAPGYVQWEWARSAPGSRIIGVAVRADGYLIAAAAHPYANNNYPYERVGDGYLHLVPPWGGAIDASNRFGPKLKLAHLVIRRGRLYAAPMEPPYESRFHNGRVPLYELDVDTGAAVRITGWVPADAAWTLAVDPKTDDLLMPGFSDPSEDGTTTRPQNLVVYNPETDTTTVLVRNLPVNSRGTGIATNEDGSVLFVPNHGGPYDNSNVQPLSTLDAYSRSGDLLYRMELRTTPYLPLFGRARCHAGKLYFVDAHPESTTGDVYAVVPARDAIPSLVAKGTDADRGDGPILVGEGAAATFDAEGNLVVAIENSVTVIGCTGDHPPATPASGGGPPPPGPSHPGPRSSGSTPGPASPGASPSPGPAQSAAVHASGPAPPALPAGPGLHPATQMQVQASPSASPAASGQATYQASMQGASQGATAPNAVGLADVRDDAAALSFSASARRRRGWSPQWAMSMTTVGLTLLAAAAVSSRDGAGAVELAPVRTRRR